MWTCLCDCGENKDINGDSLRKGKTLSCGCLQKCIAKETGEQRKKYNKYDLTGEYGIGWTSNTNEEFYFDLEDYDKIKDYTWLETKGYIYSSDREYALHRFVTNCNIDYVVDHMNHNTLDNRKENLRICSQQKNTFNQKVRSNNWTGVSGVSWDYDRNKWQAYISINGKRILLGRFDIFEDAVIARKEAEEKYFGEYSYDNSIKQYQELRDVI